MKGEWAHTGIDRVNIVFRLDRDPANAFVDHVGRAKASCKPAEIRNFGAESPEQQRAVGFVELDEERAIEVLDVPLA
jgi:hypothetical protein